MTVTELFLGKFQGRKWQKEKKISREVRLDHGGSDGPH